MLQKGSKIHFERRNLLSPTYKSKSERFVLFISVAGPDHYCFWSHGQVENLSPTYLLKGFVHIEEQRQNWKEILWSWVFFGALVKRTSKKHKIRACRAGNVHKIQDRNEVWLFFIIHVCPLFQRVGIISLCWLRFALFFLYVWFVNTL